VDPASSISSALAAPGASDSRHPKQPLAAETTWPIAKAELARALKLRSVIERAGWWN